MADYVDLEMRIEDEKPTISLLRKFLECFDTQEICSFYVYGFNDDILFEKQYPNWEYLSLDEVFSILSEHDDWKYIGLIVKFM
ncbi:MAG: hypothetical protein SVJ22_11740 [Halobacteriota archaeon]|nr:hypothetical protein [Halobacteriota archaeon]